MEGGHQFYHSVYPLIGNLVFDGIFFENEIMHYDEISDILVLIKGNRYIELHKDRISSFDLLKDHFINLQNIPGAKPGFYQEIYSGKIKVFKKEFKTITEEVVSAKRRSEKIHKSRDFLLYFNK